MVQVSGSIRWLQYSFRESASLQEVQQQVSCNRKYCSVLDESDGRRAKCQCPFDAGPQILETWLVTIGFEKRKSGSENEVFFIIYWLKTILCI
jgi:hypothetical protein